MNTSQTTRTARSWRAHALRALTIAGFAAAAWLLSGSAAQAGDSPEDALNVAQVADVATAPLGGLLDTASHLGSPAGLAPVAQTTNAVTDPVLGVTSGLLEQGGVPDRVLPATTGQVVTGLARTTQSVISVVATDVIPAELTGTAITPLAKAIAPVTDLRQLTEPVFRASGNGMVDRTGSPSPRQVTAVPGTVQAQERSTRVTSGPPAAAPTGEVSPERSSFDRDLVMAARDVSTPAAPRKPLPASPVPSGPGTGNTGSTGSLPGSHQDSGSAALVPGSVIHSAPISGVLPVTSFIGISRDSAADPMVSPD